MSDHTALLVIIDTINGGTVKRWIKTPPFMIAEGIGYSSLMRRAEKEASDIGLVRSIEFSGVPAGQKLISWEES